MMMLETNCAENFKVEFGKQVGRQLNAAMERNYAPKVELEFREQVADHEFKGAMANERILAAARAVSEQEPEIGLDADHRWICVSKEASLEQWPCGHGQYCNLCIQEHNFFFSQKGQEHKLPICPTCTCEKDKPSASMNSAAVHVRPAAARTVGGRPRVASFDAANSGR